MTLALVAVACSSADGSGSTLSSDADNTAPADAAPVDARGQTFSPAPIVPDGPFPKAVQDDLDLLVNNLSSVLPLQIIDRLRQSGDPRIAWFFADLIAFVGGDSAPTLFSTIQDLTGTEFDSYLDAVDHLIAWDIPQPPGYREMKGTLYALVEPRWAPFFTDEDADIDYRFIGWGGVFPDHRLDATAATPCDRGCIPALDDPAVTDAAGGDWYPDERAVFGVVINGEARAYPKNIMEVHEMVNDTVGGRRFGMPYCTLCLSAQAYYTDNVDGFEPVLRTSGLLSRSNKFTYDISTHSAIDTFTGVALSGPLQDAGVELEQITVVTSAWGEWKVAHPETTIVAEDGGIGRTYELDPLGGRDDDGPIFPVGDVDPRLGVQERVLGVVAADGTAIAFPVGAASLALEAGEQVELNGVSVELDGGGLRASIDGEDAVSHEAFWFAWSQFQPGTVIWQR